MMTLAEIGQLMGVTRERVRQIEAKALRKLRPPCFGTDKWMNMDSSDKLEAMMRWRGVVPMENGRQLTQNMGASLDCPQEIED
jgi:hypothetical protein